MAILIPLVGSPQIGSGGGGGSDLPAVTSEDNGDVLTVVNGAWDKAAPSGGGGNLVVRITKTVVSEQQTDYATDKTAGEIKAALMAGTPVVFPASSSSEGFTEYHTATINGNSVVFGFVEGEGWVLTVTSDMAQSSGDLEMTAASESDYLVATEGGK